MSTHRTILLKGDPLRKEGKANAAITPGDLIERMSTGNVRKHASAGQNNNRLFAVEDDLQGNGVSDNYSTNNKVQFVAARAGDEIYARIATSQTIVIGDKLESAGDGSLRKHTATSAGAVEYPEAIVGIALEAVTTTSSAGRCEVEVV